MLTQRLPLHLQCRVCGPDASHVNIDTAPGSIVGVVGRSGTGKTELLEKICGMRRVTASESVVLGGRSISEWPPNEIAASVAYVPTNPLLAFSGMATALRDELALSMAFLGWPYEVWHEHIDSVAKAFSLSSLLDRDPFTLSGGERARVALAVALIKKPSILLIDDVFPAIDREHTEAIQVLLSEQTRAGLSIIQTLSRMPSDPREPLNIVRLGETDIGTFERPNEATDAERTEDTSRTRGTHPDRLVASELCYAFPGSGGFRLGPITLEFTAGHVYSIEGHNGAGKSTLLSTLAGLYTPTKGELEIWRGQQRVPLPRLRVRHQWARHVQLCFQDPDEQLYLPTVRAELSESHRRMAGDIRRVDFEHLAASFPLERHLDKNPLELPRPLRRMVTLAAVFGVAPPFILLDEPTAGLDEWMVAALARAIARHAQHGGIVIMNSHDKSFAANIADHRIELQTGKVH